MPKFVKAILIFSLIFIASLQITTEECHYLEYEKGKEILNLRGYAPWQYRFLPYFIYIKLSELLLFLPPMTFKRALMTSWSIINFVSMSIGIYFLIKIFDKKNARYVTIFSIMLVALISKGHQSLLIYDSMVFPFIMASFYFIKKGNYKMPFLLAPLAVFFKESSGIIPLIYFLKLRSKGVSFIKSFLKSMSIFLVWLLPFLSIRFLMPANNPPIVEYTGYSWNILNFTHGGFGLGWFSILAFVFYAVPMFVLLIISMKFPLEKFQSDYKYMIIIYIIFMFAMGAPSEIRLFLPLLPFMIPNFKRLFKIDGKK